MELVDTHCHLQFDKYTDVGGVVQRAKDADVSRLICVGTSLEDSAKAVEIAGQYDNVWAGAGAHPHEENQFVDQKGASEKLLDLLSNSKKVVAVGEVGLDYYKNYSSRQDQQAALRAQIEASIDLGLPYIFHVRDAWEDFWPIFDSYPNLKGVVHSFSAHAPQLEAILRRGLYVSLNGIMTFTNDKKQLEAARRVPPGRLLLETDAPFLTPAPFRGQTCEPKHVRPIAEFLANLRGESLEELAQTTTQNALHLFNLND